MAHDPLPAFRYYRDPLGDDTIVASPEVCAACGQARGFVVTSTTGLAHDIRFCPWCVADGSAHSKFRAWFNEVAAGASPASADEVQYRTPSFPTWQDWDWPTHCGDVGVYLGQPTGEELRANPAAYEALMEDVAQYEWGSDLEYMRGFVDGLGGSQVAYLFECRHCQAQLVRWDLD